MSRRVALWGLAVCTAVGVVLAGVGYTNLRHYRLLTVRDLSVEDEKDGTYPGQFDCGFVYRVQVEVRDGRIRRVIPVANRDVHYARIAELVLRRIAEQQTPNVDAITGATTTSKCLMRAVEDALRREPSPERR